MKKIISVITVIAMVLSVGSAFAVEVPKPERPDSNIANVTEDVRDTVVNKVEDKAETVKNVATKAKDTVVNELNEAANNDEIIAADTKSELVEIKDNELKSIEDYKKAYGNSTYGFVAYILNRIRLFSIPLCFLGVAISAIYQHILGIRHLEARTKGFNSMIAIVTVFVICQVLPLVFAIVVKGWRG